MPTPSINENRGDQEQLSHVVDARSEALQDIEKNIERQRDATHGKIVNLFRKAGKWLSWGAHHAARPLRYGGFMTSTPEWHDYYDLPSEKRTSWSWKDIKNQKTAGGLSSAELMNIDGIRPEGSHAFDTEVSVAGAPSMAAGVHVDFEKFTEWNQDDTGLKAYVERHRAAGTLEEIGIMLSTGSGHSLSQAQGEELAVRIANFVLPHRERRDLGIALQGEGVSPLNWRMAMEFAQQLGRGTVSNILSGGQEKMKKEIESLNAKAKLAKAFQMLASLRPGNASAGSAKEIEDEMKEVANDWHDLQLGVPRPARSAVLKPRSLNVSDPKKKEGFESILSDAHSRLEDAMKPYKALADAISSVYKLHDSAKPLPKIFTDLVDTTSRPIKVHLDQLKPDMDPEDIVKQVRSSQDIAEKDYAAEAGILKAKMELSGAKPKVGVDAVLAIYQAMLKSKGRNEQQAEAEALQLFADNKLSDPDLKRDIRRIIENDVLRGQMGKQKLGVFGWFAQQGKELWYGSQEQFVSTLAEAVGVNSTYGPWEIMDRTRRLGILWRKRNARPLWGNLDNEQLLRAFLALREAVKQNHLAREHTTTSYVREQLVEVGELLATRSMDQAWHDYFNTKAGKPNGAQSQPEESRAVQFAEKVANLNGDIRKLLRIEIPEEEKTKVQGIVDTATANTGWKRRLLGRGATTVAGAALRYGVATPAQKTWQYGVVTPVKKGWEYGVVEPYELGKSIVMRPINVGMGAVSGISSGVRSGVGNLFQYLFVDKKKFYGSTQASSH